MECFLGAAIFGLPVRQSQWRKSDLGKKSIKYLCYPVLYCVILVIRCFIPCYTLYGCYDLEDYKIASYRLSFCTYVPHGDNKILSL